MFNKKVFLDLGVPVNEVEDDQELEDVIEMNEPEIENEQNEAFGDDMSEYEEDGDNENDESDEEEEDTEDGKIVRPWSFAKKFAQPRAF